jgi:hypothetical protein
MDSYASHRILPEIPPALAPGINHNFEKVSLLNL